MTKTDTSANAVERLAYAMEARIIETYGGHGTVLERPDDDCNAAAATLRALLAERDEAIDQRNAADFVLALSIEQSTRHSVERDAARAEVERLRDALSAARDNIAGRFGADATNTIDAALIARIDAAIAKEPGHE